MNDLEADVALSIASVVGCDNPFYVHKAMAQKAIATTVQSLRRGAVARVLRAIEDWKRHQSIMGFVGSPAMSRDDFARLCVAAILGPDDDEPDSPDASDIADMRYDEHRATERDES